MRTLFIAALAAFLAAAFCHTGMAGEMIIWYDDAGVAHAAASADEIPERHRPQTQGVMTALTDEAAKEAVRLGAAKGSDPALYQDGLGLFQPFTYELDMDERTGHVFVGTKFSLVRARAASASAKGEKFPAGYAAKAAGTDRLPVAFYSWGFETVLLLMMQDGKLIKGDDGFPEGLEPGLKVPAHVKSFPYDVIDFSKPVEVQVYNREGKSISFRLDLPEYR